ncbi:MAG TPA: hypothetical protein VH475_19265 [Tepidisphaeraceae bacterium]
MQKHAAGLLVTDESPNRYCLQAPAGPAALKAWGGRRNGQQIPVAWVRVGKGYVSYHLMGIYGNPKLCDGMSKGLKARMQGKSCFNFKKVDPSLFDELDRLTARSIKGFRSAGFISDQQPA